MTDDELLRFVHAHLHPDDTTYGLSFEEWKKRTQTPKEAPVADTVKTHDEIHSKYVPAEEKKINTRAELDEILRAIRIENSCLNFKWDFEAYDCMIRVGMNHAEDHWRVNVGFERPDTHTGKVGWGRGRFEFIKVGATESAVVKTCWLLVELVVRHELMEGFKYNGVRIFDPHKTVEELSHGSRV